MKIRAQVDKNVHDVEIERTDGLYAVVIDGYRRMVDAQSLESDFYSLLLDGKSYEVSIAADKDAYHVRHGGFETTVRFADPARTARQAMGVGEGPQKVLAVMPGKVVRVLVEEGDEVDDGQGLVVVEAMKMENEIAAPKAGKIRSVEVRPGETVESGAVLLVVE
jgi:biotin carboxyl carrier protein